MPSRNARAVAVIRAATLYACRTCPPFLTPVTHYRGVGYSLQVPFIGVAELGGVGLAGVIGAQVLAESILGVQHLSVAHHTTFTPTLAFYPAAAQETQGAQSPQGT